MPASPEKIREVIEQYVATVARGTTDEILELFAEGATVEDPVGTEVRSTREAIREFYSGLEGLEQEGRVSPRGSRARRRRSCSSSPPRPATRPTRWRRST